MSRVAQIVILICVLLGGLVLGRLSMTSGGDTKSGPEDKPFEFLQPYSVRPEQFAVFPCTRRTGFDDMYAACVLVIAGGKRLVFGAPLGQDWRGIGRVDGVFLPNGHPVSIGSLTGLRHRTWWAGRTSGLLVVGGELLIDEIKILEEGQNRADALASLEFDDPIDFLDAQLRPKPVPSLASRFKVFDSGDLQVYASSRTSTAGDQHLSYEIRYGGQALYYEPCGGPPLKVEGGVFMTPTADKSSLVRYQRLAAETQQFDLVRDLQRNGEHCLSSAEALTLIRETGIKDAILLRPGRDVSNPIGKSAANVRILDENGLMLSAKSTAE